MITDYSGHSELVSESFDIIDVKGFKIKSDQRKIFGGRESIRQKPR